MIIKGQHNTAEIFTDDIEKEAVKQIEDLCDDGSFKNSKIAVMPDVHAGNGCTIGTTMTLPDRCVVPSHVGVDIGCGVTALKIDKSYKELFSNLGSLERAVTRHVPSGFAIHEIHTVKGYLDAAMNKVLNLYFLDHLERTERDEIIDRVYRSVGTLGGGNHFIELDQREDSDELLLVVHSGSRQLGYKCCQYYQKQIGKTSKAERQALIDSLKRQNRQHEIQTELLKLNDKPHNVLTGELYVDYIHDIDLIQRYAHANRMQILILILFGLGMPPEIMGGVLRGNIIESVHNYIDLSGEIPVLRKGAISAKKGETVIIPFNMRDGLVVAKGLGNPKWNYSAPHGCGRRMSRTKAFNELSMQEFEKDMQGIYTESVDQSTLDEAPQAYKDYKTVYDHMVGRTITDPVLYKPVYNYKHHESKIESELST